MISIHILLATLLAILGAWALWPWIWSLRVETAASLPHNLRAPPEIPRVEEAESTTGDRRQDLQDIKFVLSTELAPYCLDTMHQPLRVLGLYAHNFQGFQNWTINHVPHMDAERRRDFLFELERFFRHLRWMNDLYFDGRPGPDGAHAEDEDMDPEGAHVEDEDMEDQRG